MKRSPSPPDKKYRFAGQGRGVPGLPHEISMAQAKAQGYEALLKAAIQNGNYVEVAGEQPAAEEDEHVE